MRLRWRLAWSYVVFLVLFTLLEIALLGLFLHRAAAQMMAYPDLGARALLANFGLGFLASLVGVGALCVLLGTLYARQLTEPLKQLQKRLASIGAASRPAPLPAEGRDEFAELASAYNRLLERLGRAEAAREQADRARRELVANLSHDIRTPLTSLRGFAEALCDEAESDPETRRHYADVIQRRVAELDAMVDDLSQLSRLQTTPSLVLAPLDLAETVREAVIPLVDDFQRAGIELAINLPDAPLTARVDGTLLQRAVANLLMNTLQHAGGATRVEVSLASDGQAALIAVADNGAGVDGSLLPHIFDRYYRGTSADAPGRAGSGLGLAIVQEVARAHGGDASVRNLGVGTGAPDGVPGGARFEMRIPLGAP